MTNSNPYLANFRTSNLAVSDVKIKAYHAYWDRWDTEELHIKIRESVFKKDEEGAAVVRCWPLRADKQEFGVGRTVWPW